MKKKKIFRRVIAVFLAFLSLMSIGIQAAAAMLAAGAIEGLVAICVTIAAACGLMSQSEAENKAVNMPKDLVSEVSEFLMNEAADPLTPYKSSIAALKAAGKIKEVTDGLQDYINERQKIEMSPGGGGDKGNNNDKKVIGGIMSTIGIVDFIHEAQSHVKQVADGSVDMGGYGAVLYMPNVNGREYEMYFMSYGEFYYVSNQLYFKTHGIGKRTFKSFGGDPITFDYSENRSGTYQSSYTYYGDWRYSDGTKADDYTTSVDTKPSSIGEVTDADGNTYPVNADGTVTVNGEDVPINEDGTVTINGDTYNVSYNLSAYDDTAVIDLLQRILEKIDQSQIIDETPADDVSSIPLPAVDADFESLQLSPSIATVFPFCIPWDLVRGIKLLAADPVAPRFEVPFNVPAIGDIFPGYEGSVIVDFAEYDKYFKVVRWGTFMIAMFGICFLTFKIVKGNT